jgi:hypothetical protein
MTNFILIFSIFCISLVLFIACVSLFPTNQRQSGSFKPLLPVSHVLIPGALLQLSSYDTDSLQDIKLDYYPTLSIKAGTAGSGIVMRVTPNEPSSILELVMTASLVPTGIDCMIFDEPCEE